MSELTECSQWSTEEGDLDQIDKQVQLVSTSSDSQSISSHTKDDINKMDVAIEATETKNAIDSSRQSNNSCDNLIMEQENLNKIDLGKSKLHMSCNDLLMVPVENKFDIRYPKTSTPPGDTQTKKLNFKRSASCTSLITGEKSNTRRKYDHVQSKVKQYFKNHSNKTDSSLPPKPKSPKNIIEIIEKPNKSPDKAEYLEEINKRLTRELDEKNAILTKLQENYEQLLFKYAEAQNRIDQLRFKAINGSSENTSRSGFKPKSARTSIRIPLNSFYNTNDFTDGKEEVGDVKCQKAIVAPFMKSNDENKSDCDGTGIINRPSSLPIETNLKVVERDALKAATPTDSEGVSSVITSMSGHSKILNTLDEENDKKSEVLQYQTSEFILEDNLASNDPFDKVKNWQNSLPPLELIETPDTTLYDVPQNLDQEVSPSTNYNEISPCSNVNKNPHIDDTFPYWHEKGAELHRSRSDYQKNKVLSQAVMKKYLRTLSLPGSLTKRNLMSIIYKRKNHHTIDLSDQMRSDYNEEMKIYQNNENQISSPKMKPNNDIPSSCIIQRRKKKPPLLRCSSLPAYDYDSPKSGSGRNPGLYIPPLDLDNLTLSDDESSPQMEYDLSKSNVNTSPSFITSHGGSMECSFQTFQSGNSNKATISEYSDSQFVRPTRPIFHKSTSITPDRSKIDFLNSEPAKICSPDCDMYRGEDKSKLDSKNWCNVCGETISIRSPSQNFPYRSNSFQSVQEIKDPIAKSSIRHTRYPFNRSVSFNSENNSPNYCFHEDGGKNISPYEERKSNDSLEKFDIYANNLKARSQVIMKALTAHVNNS